MRLPPNNNKDFEDCPVGTWPARCFKIVDLGTQTGEFKGKVKLQRKVIITFEVYADKRMDDGRPFSASKWFTFSSFSGAQLFKFLEAWRGAPLTEKEIDDPAFMNKLLGAPCLLSLAKSKPNSQGKIYVNIQSAMRAPKGMEVPPLENKTVLFDLENYDDAIFKSLSDSVQKAIMQSPEYKALQKGHDKAFDQPHHGHSSEGSVEDHYRNEEIADDEIPF